jgi:hypothetical protein
MMIRLRQLKRCEKLAMKSVSALVVSVITAHQIHRRTLLIGETLSNSNLISMNVTRLQATGFPCENLETPIAAGAQIKMHSTCREQSRRREGANENTSAERKRKIKGAAHCARKQLSARGFSQHIDQSALHMSSSDVSESLGNVAAQLRSTTPERDRSQS